MQFLKYKLAATFCFFVVLAFAQKNLPGGQVDVVKQFNARLIEAERFVLPPVLPPIDTSTRRQNYYLQARPLNVNYPAPKIRPLAWKSDPEADTYKTYIQAGIGYPSAIYVDASHDFIADEDLNIGLDVYHYSADNSKRVENQKFSESNINLNGIYKTKSGYSVSGNVGYDLNTVHYYGYTEKAELENRPRIPSFAAEDVRQRFKKFYANAKAYNIEPTVADINVSAEADLYSLSDNFTARETGFLLGVGASKWFEKKHPLSIKLIADFTGFEDSTSQSLNNVFLQPNFSYHGDRFRLKIGANIASHENEFFIYPDVEASINLVDNLITAFAGGEGGLRKNTFSSITDYNPFIAPRGMRLENSFYNNFYGGIKGEIKGIRYRGQVGFKDVKNLALFTTNRDSIPRFNVVYDTAQIVYISGELSTDLMDNLALTANFTQNFFTMEGGNKPWHLPSVTLNVGAILRMLDDKLQIRGDLFMQNGVPVQEGPTGSRNLNALVDVSAGAQYSATENIGVFVRVNNMLNNLRQRWEHYPVMGINGLVGLTARF
jgi:hypothetical protein